MCLCVRRNLRRTYHRFMSQSSSLHVRACPSNPSSACPRQGGTFADGCSYTGSCRRGCHRSCHNCGTLATAVAARLSSSSLRKFLDSHRPRHHRDATHFSSRNCERFGCGSARERATGKFWPSSGCTRGSIDTRSPGFVLASASTRLSRFCDTF